ncbi:MAG TPA: glycosyltransferase [Burkholderiales bacterium]|nr:glycosyltransferase [Burkholderiales bacterium]
MTLPRVPLPWIEVVAATRLPKSGFWAKTALGQSLQRISADRRVSSFTSFENRSGLPRFYNQRIETDGPDVLVFAHDDVWLDDYHFAQRLLDGLDAFDVVGVAGNRRRVARQPAWAFLDMNLTVDSPDNLSGAVAHGSAPFGAVTYYGVYPAPASCELLDGMLLATRRSTLVKSGVRFDPRFAFHFYDMDFCRSARQAGMRLGTWPLSVTHQSSGAFGSAPWREGYERYIEKWGD